MQQTWGISLRTKATAAVLAIILVALGVTAAVSIVQSNHEIAAEQRRSADAISHSLARSAELALAVRDEAELARLATGFLWDPNILFIALCDEKGTVLSKAVQSSNAWKFYEAKHVESPAFLLSEKTVVISSTGEFGQDVSDSLADRKPSQRTVGKVVVALSTEPMETAQRRQTLLTGGLTLATALLCAMLTSVVVGAWTRRLEMVVTASETIARGDYSQGIRVPSRDEIGRLASAFEQMRLTVQQRDQTLLHRVEERTGDLEMARRSAEKLALSSQEAGARIRAILDAAADGIITINDEGLIESVNSAAERIFGFAPRVMIGHNIAQFVPSLDQHDAGASLRAFVGARREVTGRRKDGATFPMEMNVSEVQLGRRIYTGIVRDITEIKDAQLKLDATNKQLLQASRQAGMAEVATGVLHNVGNVLNSVNVSATLIAERLSNSKVTGLGKAMELLNSNSADLAAYLTANEKGKQIPAYLTSVTRRLLEEQAELLREISLLAKNIEHIKDIVSMQQAYAGASGIVEKIQATELVEDALRMNAAALARHDVIVVREFIDKPEIVVDKHKVLQILINFIRNAKYAMDEAVPNDRRLTLRVACEGEMLAISVKDTGTGISAENLTRVFTHGFTTRREGHGFGLHSGALAAREMGGEISAHSDGAGQGATFTVKLPLNPRAKLL